MVVTKNISGIYFPFVAKKCSKNIFNDEKENEEIIAFGDIYEELESFCIALGYNICKSPSDEGIIITHTNIQDSRKTIYTSKFFEVPIFKLSHYDDKKGKYQSHEITMTNDKIICNTDIGVYSNDFSDIIGYGETKEEAYKDFLKKYEYLLNQYQNFFNLLSTKCIDFTEVN